MYVLKKNKRKIKINKQKGNKKNKKKTYLSIKNGLYIQIKHTCLLNTWVIYTNKTYLSIKHMG